MDKWGLLHPFYQWVNEGPEKLSDFPKAAQQAHARNQVFKFLCDKNLPFLLFLSSLDSRRVH